MASLVVLPDYICSQIDEKMEAILEANPQFESDKEDIRANIVHYFLEGYSLDSIQIEPAGDME